jgi:exopolyphosphatase/guanosine-5'-triphosphate,3'-diphosphate pyrophosphatase
MNKRNYIAAIIDIGSHVVRLDISEIRNNSIICPLESLSRPITLGFDVFRYGSVSTHTMDQLITILKAFQNKIKEYQATQIRIIATSAIREAFNRELIADRIQRETNLTLEVLESQQEIMYIFQAMKDVLQKNNAYPSNKSVAIVLGAGSIFVFATNQKQMQFCEEIPLGTVRLYDAFGHSEVTLSRLAEALNSPDIPRRMLECANITTSDEVNLIVMGAASRMLSAITLKTSPADENSYQIIDVNLFNLTLNNAVSGNIGKFADTLQISPEDGLALEAGAVILKYFTDKFNCQNVICPGVTTRSALLLDFIKGNSFSNEEFLPDLISICTGIAKKYGADIKHSNAVHAISTKLLEKLKRDFSFNPRAEFLLAVAAYLHDIGRFVDTRSHHLHSAYLIANMQLPGITHAERKIISLLARYHRKEEPLDVHLDFMQLAAEDKVTVLKLAAIIRVADALDSSRCSRFSQIEMRRSGNTIFLSTLETDIFLEELKLENKGKLFTRVFGLEVKLESTL